MQQSALAAIRDVLSQHQSVRLALVFGSVARGRTPEDSDIDVAVDMEMGTDLAQLSAELTQAASREAQLVILSDAGVPLLDEILRDGIVVYERRPNAAASWRSHVLADMEVDRPWYARMRDAWLRKVAERGIVDGDRNVITAKLTDLAVRIGRLRKHCKPSSAALAADPDALDLVAFNLMLAVQICADIASHIIADAGWPGARTLAEAFGRLHEHEVLTQPTSAALSRAAGLRNVLAHGYAAVDVTLVQAAATQDVTDLDSFAREVAAWLSQQE